MELRTAITIILGLCCHVCYCQNVTDPPKLECIKCESTSDQSCITNPTASGTTKCDATNCFTKIDTSGNVIRGCDSPETVCTGSSCQKCDSALCNNNLVCKACNAENDAACAQTNVDDPKYNSLCGAGQKFCVSQLNGDFVTRGCGTATDCLSESNTCQKCSAPNCNKGLFPKDGLSCYQCNGDKCNEVTASAQLRCVRYRSGDQCYTKGTSATNMQRGCLSDIAKDACDVGKFCRQCDAKNCNQREYERDQTLQCVQCDSATDKDCASEQKPDAAKSCAQKILFTAEEACFTERLANKTQVRRGCLYDRPAEAGSCSDPDCTSCASPKGCNNAAVALSPSFTCIRCNSGADKRCSGEAHNLTGTLCSNEALVVDAAAQQCYTGLWNGHVIRGCLVDANNAQQMVCKDKSQKQCKICDGKDCNTQNFKDSGVAGMNVVSSAALVLVAAVLWRLL